MSDRLSTYVAVVESSIIFPLISSSQTTDVDGVTIGL